MSIEHGPSAEEMGLKPEDLEGSGSDSTIEDQAVEATKDRERASAGQELVEYFTERAQSVVNEITALEEEKVNLEKSDPNNSSLLEIDQKIEQLKKEVQFAQDKVKEGVQQRDEFDRLSKQESTPEVIAKIQEQAEMNRAIIDLDKVESADKVIKGSSVSDKVMTNLKRAAAVLAVFVSIGPSASKAQEEKGLDLVWKNIMSIVKPETTAYAKDLIKQGIEYDKIKDQWELLKQIEINVKQVDFWTSEFKERSQHDWSESNSKRYEYSSSLKLGNSTGRGGDNGGYGRVGLWLEDLADIIDNFDRFDKLLDKQFSQADGRIINTTELQQRVAERRDELEKMRKDLDSHFKVTDVLPSVEGPSK